MAAVPQQVPTMPAVPQQPVIINRLPTNRSMAKLFWLGLITLGIYDIVIFTEMSSELNRLASPHDHKKTMNFCLLFFVIGIITFGIGYLVWWHRFSNRIGDELERRGKPRTMSASTYWVWNILGSLIIVGWFVYMHRLCVAMNTLAADYNVRG